MAAGKLTKSEKEQIEDLLEAGEEHEGFVGGRDVMVLAKIIFRLFSDDSAPPTRRRNKKADDKDTAPAAPSSEKTMDTPSMLDAPGAATATK